jgi:hypothetical protein
MFTYYVFVDNLHRDPHDLDDLIDGLLYLDAKSYSQKRAMEKK